MHNLVGREQVLNEQFDSKKNFFNYEWLPSLFILYWPKDVNSTLPTKELRGIVLSLVQGILTDEEGTVQLPSLLR